MTGTPMSATTTKWMRTGVIGLATFAFVGNSGHSYELLNGADYAHQEWWLALGGAALPDLLLIICVIRLRHDLKIAWGWIGVALSGVFVFWAGWATADKNLTAQVCSAWPLAVALCAAGLLEYETTGSKAVVKTQKPATPKTQKAPAHRAAAEVPASEPAEGLHLVGGSVEKHLIAARALDDQHRAATKTPANPSGRPVSAKTLKKELPIGDTTAQKLVVVLRAPEKETAHG